jgi:hypothetical protein
LEYVILDEKLALMTRACPQKPFALRGETPLKAALIAPKVEGGTENPTIAYFFSAFLNGCGGFGYEVTWPNEPKMRRR